MIPACLTLELLRQYNTISSMVRAADYYSLISLDSIGALSRLQSFRFISEFQVRDDVLLFKVAPFILCLSINIFFELDV